MDIAKLKSAINTLEKIDPADKFAYEKAIIAFESIGHLPILIKKIEETIKIFRTRTHDSPDYFTKISDISITPSSYVKAFARCNKPYQSIFYGAENRPTSFMELVEYWAETTKFGDKLFVTIGMWETTKPVNLIIVTTPDITKRDSDFDKEHGLGYDEHLKKRSKEDQQFSSVFYNYMFDKFRSRAKHDLKTYIITSAYSNLALTRAGGNADGISYPSVPFNEKGVNFALLENYFKSSLRLINVMRLQFEISPTDQGKHKFTELQNVMTNKISMADGTIEW